MSVFKPLSTTIGKERTELKITDLIHDVGPTEIQDMILVTSNSIRLVVKGKVLHNPQMFFAFLFFSFCRVWEKRKRREVQDIFLRNTFKA